MHARVRMLGSGEQAGATFELLTSSIFFAESLQLARFSITRTHFVPNATTAMQKARRKHYQPIEPSWKPSQAEEVKFYKAHVQPGRKNEGTQLNFIPLLGTGAA
jgi:hypothetical protein